MSADPSHLRLPSRSVLSLAVLLFGVLVLFLVAPGAVLTVFAGLMLALFLLMGGGALSRRLSISDHAGVGLFALLLGGGFALLFVAFAPSVMAQLNQLATDLPDAIGTLRTRLEGNTWMRPLYRALQPEEPAGIATGALTATLGGLASAVIVAFIGFYGAFNPEPYRNGLLSLVSPDLRPKARLVLARMALLLRGWLLARLFSMAVVGTLTTLGLWLAGVPLAVILGLIAGLLGFIPNIGPILSAVPALLLALSQGSSTVWIVAGLYVVVQTIETYVLTPVVEERETSIPPALVLSGQLLMGTLYGLLGLALASPLVAVMIVLIREVYVHGVLEAEDPLDGPGQSG
jgi:predicted PurR-regulated permease PerM